MEANISTAGATLVGVVLLALERFFYYVVVLLMRKELNIHCNSCCGLCKGSVEMEDTDKEEEEEGEEMVGAKPEVKKEVSFVHS